MVRKMVKHKFIDKANIDKIFFHTRNSDVVISLYENICDIEPITEQEIVKPYLEKLITKMQKLRGCSCSNSDGVIDDIEDMIDKLLSEDGDEE